MREIWIATGNAGKAEEFKLILSERGFSVHDLRALKTPYTPPPENGTTYAENAKIKAKSLSRLVKSAFVLADDSGIEVEGLGALPGVHSARYAGPKCSATENVAKLLKMLNLRSPLNRKAKMVCSLHLMAPEVDSASTARQEWSVTAEMMGEIAAKASAIGSGFGYDPVFIPSGESRTLAELGVAYKLKHSHRALALEKLLDELSSLESS